MKHFINSIAVVAGMLLSLSFFPVQTVSAYDKTVTYNDFPAVINDGEPVRGVDISSIISIEKATKLTAVTITIKNIFPFYTFENPNVSII